MKVSGGTLKNVHYFDLDIDSGENNRGCHCWIEKDVYQGSTKKCDILVVRQAIQDPNNFHKHKLYGMQIVIHEDGKNLIELMEPKICECERKNTNLYQG